MTSIRLARAGKRTLIAGCIVIGTVAATSSVAGAAEPANQACVGQSVSAGAHAIDQYGHFVELYARNDTPGIGVEVQRLQAGLVPDSLAPNTCND